MTKEMTKQDIYKELEIIEDYFDNIQKSQKLLDKLIIYHKLVKKYHDNIQTYQTQKILDKILILHVVVEKAWFKDKIINDDNFFDITSRLNKMSKNILMDSNKNKNI